MAVAELLVNKFHPVVTRKALILFAFPIYLNSKFLFPEKLSISCIKVAHVVPRISSAPVPLKNKACSVVFRR